ncbi:MAG TPA: DNA repair protein RecO [Dehalococcoidia bacterium]|nr:DNA repair protein RecO [Dehalococcoidia bacterium]
MPPPRTYRAEGLVLKNIPFGEADLLVTLYSRESGKLRAVARGARRSNSRMVGHFEPLTVARLSLARGRSLDIVNQVEVTENFSSLKSDLTTLARGLYVAELVDGFGSEASSNRQLYDLAIETLGSIRQHPARELVLRRFELHLMRAAGFMPELFHCVECRKPLEPEQHRFSPDAGGTLCLDCTPSGVQIRTLSLRALKVLRMLHRSGLADLPQLSPHEPLEQEVKSILGTAIGYWMDKEIRTNSFLNHLEHWPRAEVSS